MSLFDNIVVKYSKIFIFTAVLSSCIYADGCLIFSSPKPGKVITSPLCTLSLQTTCDDIRRIELQARYFPPNKDTATIISLGTINHPPYQFIWNLDSIPNQLFAGVAFLAEVIHRNGEIEDTRREGVFFAHKSVSYEKKKVFYGYPGTKTLSGDTIIIPSDRVNLSIKSSVYWNEKDLSFVINVDDPFFNSNISKTALSEIGAEIMLDTSNSRKPYPSKDIIAFSIPLYGIPYIISYKPAFDDNGTFKLVSSSSPCDFHYSIIKDDYKGYKIYFPIPKKVFGNKIPDSLTCNIVLNVLNQSNQLTKVSWVKNSLYDIQSPYVWNSISRVPKPISKNLILIGSVSFVTGLIFSLLISLFIRTISKPKLKKAIEKTETEQKLFDDLKEAIDHQITYKNLSIEVVAKELHISPQKLSGLTKKLTGMSFINYLMFARIEIAKERLRSSFCNESTIADACGFKDQSEFEKYFLKFERITASKYRQQQQVT